MSKRVQDALPPHVWRSSIDPSQQGIFSKLGEYGLISFSDYIFLLTVLSSWSSIVPLPIAASPRHFELAFKMFDGNGDGNLDYAEFERVDDVVRGRTAVGNRLREHAAGGCQLHAHHHSALAKHFFGDDLRQLLTIGKFLQFQVGEVYTVMQHSSTTCNLTCYTSSSHDATSRTKGESARWPSQTCSSPTRAYLPPAKRRCVGEYDWHSQTQASASHSPNWPPSSSSSRTSRT